MKLTVRQASESDAGAILGLMDQFGDYLRELGDTSDCQFSQETYRRDGFASEPAFFGLVAESNDDVVGYLLYHFGYDIDLAAKTLHIIDLYVEARYRAKGVGRALMMKAMEVCHEVGARELDWEVYKSNHCARQFYERLGGRYIDDEEFMYLDVGALDEHDRKSAE